jgi:hypothetical protein
MIDVKRGRHVVRLNELFDCHIAIGYLSVSGLNFKTLIDVPVR